MENEKSENAKKYRNVKRVLIEEFSNFEQWIRFADGIRKCLKFQFLRL